MTRGLLHSASRESYQDIRDILSECVIETRPNGRIKAIHRLMSALKNIFSPV